MMCIAVSAVCICIFMFFYDSSAYWTKRPFRTVRYWQALPFTLTILLACIVRWAHQTAEMWFPLKPMYDFNLIQQSQKKKEREWAQESFIKYSFSLHLLFFVFIRPPFLPYLFPPLSPPSFLSSFFLFSSFSYEAEGKPEKWLYLSESNQTIFYFPNGLRLISSQIHF